MQSVKQPNHSSFRDSACHAPSPFGDEKKNRRHAADGSLSLSAGNPPGNRNGFYGVTSKEKLSSAMTLEGCVPNLR